MVRLGMLQPDRWMSRVIRIAVIEPSEADAYWFELLLKEARVQVELIHYSTGMHALEEFANGRHSVIDLVVVADLLPMLPLQEFVDAVQKVYPGVHVVVAGERTRLPSKLQVRKSEFYVKPLTLHNLRSLLTIASLENSTIAASRS